MKDLKSKVLKEFDFRKADVSEVDFTYEADKGFIEREFLRVKKKNVVTFEVDTIAKGDIVLCSLKSNNPKYNKEVSINSSIGIFKKEVTEKLNGMKKGETLTFSVDGDDVNIKILKIERRDLPESITDEMVIKEGINGVDTVKNFEKYVENLQREDTEDIINEKLYYLEDYVLNQVVSQSQFEIYDEDIQYLCDLDIQHTKVLAENDGLVLEKMTAEEFKDLMSVASYEEFLDEVKNTQREQIYALVMGIKNAKESGYEPSKEKYEEFLQEYYLSNMESDVARKAYQWDYYEVADYVNYYRDQISNYYKERYKEV